VRISVVGCSGSGKSTVGRTLALRLGVPFVELDSIHWQADWQPLTDDEFRRRVADVVAGDGWVIDGNYEVVRALIVARATDVVWLDLPRPVVMAQVVARSLRRAVDGRELWNGNRERISTWLDPEHPIRWAWVHHGTKRVSYPARFASPEYAHVRTHRLTSRRAANRFAAELPVEA
jgi:adenylate kinase family enzyme